MRKFREVFLSEPFFEEFYLYNLGHEECVPGHSYGPAIRETYIIHYITSGKGILKTKESVYNLSKGEFFILRPEEIGYYKADLKEPWTYYWIGFSGDKADQLLENNGLYKTGNVGKIGINKQLIELFEKLIDISLYSYLKKVDIQALFLKIFSYFKFEKVVKKIDGKKYYRDDYYHSFLLYVRNNYYRSDLRVTDIAKFLGLHPVYLSQLIKKEFEVSPAEYIRSYRLHQASIILETTNNSIQEVASKVGYLSSKSFSKAFKNKFKVSPSQYTGKH